MKYPCGYQPRFWRYRECPFRPLPRKYPCRLRSRDQQKIKRIVFVYFSYNNGFLAPWDPSQKKVHKLLFRVEPLRPLYDEMAPSSGQLKFEILRFGVIPKTMVWTSGNHQADNLNCCLFLSSSSRIRRRHQFPSLRLVIQM